MSTNRIPKCDQCDSVYINGAYCHEHGCPNKGKQWDAEREWISCIECPECPECGYAIDRCDCEDVSGFEF